MGGAPVQALVVLRSVVGVSSWLAPNHAGKLFGLDPAANPQASYLGRLFGIRDIALAAGPAASTGEAQRLWLALGLTCDLFDAAAGVLAGRAGVLPKHATVMVTGVALAAAGLGVAALTAGDETAAVEPPPPVTG